MLHFVGVGLLLAGAVGIGLSAVGTLRYRVAILADMMAALTFMERELSFHCTPMPQLLHRVAGRSTPAVATFFLRCHTLLLAETHQNFSALWRQAISEVTGLDLDPQTTSNLAQLGDTLGRYDVTGQCTALRRAVTDLETATQEAQAQFRRLRRVYPALAVSGGMMLVILLL